jgi:hypothetical protein
MMIDRRGIAKIQECYNADHDLGPDAPVHWTIAELANVVDKLCSRIEELEAEVQTLKNAYRFDKQQAAD